MNIRQTLSRKHEDEALSVVVVDVAQPGPDLQAALSRLPASEAQLAASWAPKRQATFASGRHALRLALVAAGATDDVWSIHIGRDDRGAPVLPTLSLANGRRLVSVSITHKDHIAAALVVSAPSERDVAPNLTRDVAPDVGRVAWGLDLEIDDGRPRKEALALARMVLVDDEFAVVDAIDDAAACARATFERFSLKEALYKGLDPFLRRYVGFKEVGVVVSAGSAAFVVPFAGLAAHGFVIAVDDAIGADVVLTAARVTMSP